MIIEDKKELTKFISSFILGDGGLFKNSTENSNARYMLSQTYAHLDYVEWQQSILNNVTSSTISVKEAYTDRNGTNHKKQLKLQTKSLPLFTTIRNRWYIEGKKVVSPHDILQMDLQMLAILYMDDGNLNKTSGRTRTNKKITLCTHSFSWADNNLLRDTIASKLNFHFDVNKASYPSGIKYMLTMKDKYVYDFVDAMKPYMLPSFNYKVDLS